MTSKSPPSPPNPPSSQPNEPAWVGLVLLAAAVGMALILWLPQEKKSPKPRKKSPKRLRVVMAQPLRPSIRILPPRQITVRVAPRKRARIRPLPAPVVSYNPAELFNPIPFSLKLEARRAFYQKKFAEAAKLKRGVHERLFLTQLHKEHTHESTTKAIRTGFLRLTVMRYLRYRGHLQYRKMGFLQLQIFEKLLQEYLAKKGPIDKIPTDNQTYAVLAARLAAYAGHYPLLLRNVGVKANQRALTPIQQFWLRTLFMSRWFRAGAGHYPLPILMGTSIYVDYNKARFLYSRNEKKRIFYAHEIKRLEPKLPHFRVLGWLWAQLKRTKLARLALKDALKQDPKDKIARRLLDKLPKS